MVHADGAPSARPCVICRAQVAAHGLLCGDCHDALSSGVSRLCPEQLFSNVVKEVDAALIDQWGRAHALDTRTLLGRRIDGPGVSMLEGSVSRRHAVIEHAPGGAWHLTDLDSANGTFLDEEPVQGTVPLRRGATLFLGQVGFYFVDVAAAMLPWEMPESVASTLRPGQPVPALPGSGAHFEEEKTPTQLPVAAFRVHEPTGGGGGVIDINDRQLQLSATQFEFLVLLARRMTEESHQPDVVRGFVRGSELIADLSWDSRHPDENHLKQLVRRVRRALIKADVGDLIESRRSFGYRLRVIPRSI